MKVAGATDIPSYLAGLPPDRRAILRKARSFVRKHLPKGYKEEFGCGMITWVIPLSVYPDTYNGKPLLHSALSSQKNSLVLYLMGPYADKQLEARLRAGFKKAGKRLDMGKSCIRFKTLDDLALPVIAETIAAVSMEKHVALAKAMHPKMKK